MVNTITDEALRTVVAEWLERPLDARLIPRAPARLDLEEPRLIQAVIGPRRAGKTSLMFLAADALIRAGKARRQDFLFVDFEDYRLQGFAPGDADRLLAAFHHLTGDAPRYLLFDEIQHVLEWSRLLRTLHNQQRYRIVISGSNTDVLASNVATELRGRCVDQLVLPFSFAEYLTFHKVPAGPIQQNTPARGRIVRALEEYLQEGGFPEVVGRSDPVAKRQLLQMYYRTIFYRDLLERQNIRAREVLDRMMAYLLDTFAASFSISSFGGLLKAADVSGSKRTIAQYLRFLQEAFFVIALQRFTYSPKKRTVTPQKVYLIDSGFARLGQPFSENRGKLLENMVAVELFRRRKEVFFHSENHECDFVIKEGTKPVEAIQVCWDLNPGNEKRELKGLLEAMETWRIPKGLILTANQEGQRQAGRGRVQVKPVWKWALQG